MPGKKTNERFIAGAVCPACHALDRIVVSSDDEGIEHQRCVSCGYAKQGRPSAGTPPSVRLQRHEPTPSKAIRIVDPGDPD
ncbi:MAG: YheV family putative zinc ribbon protein [Pseudomonadales bacterium]